MHSLTRRLATVTLGGALLVGSLTGCGIFGTAVDCGKLAAATNDVTSNMSDADGLKNAIEKFRSAAKDIDDAELKDSVNTFADEAEKFQQYIENPTGEVPDESKMLDAASDIEAKCS